MIIYFEEKSGGSKLSWHAYASRDSPPSHILLDQNLDPRVQGYVSSAIASQPHMPLGIMNVILLLSKQNMVPDF